MANVVGGVENGLLNSSLFFLNRNDQTHGPSGNALGDSVTVNVANGNLLVQHQDAFLPSRGQDYQMLRTYNLQPTKLPSGHETAQPFRSRGWSSFYSIIVIHRPDVESVGVPEVRVQYGDGTQKEFSYNASTKRYVSHDGAGAAETLVDLGRRVRNGKPRYILTLADQSVLKFDREGRILSWADTNGVTTKFQYKGRDLIRVRDDQGHVLNYRYKKGDLVEIQDRRNNVLVRYEYHKGNNHLASVTDRMGHETRYYYNDRHQLIRIEMPDRQVIDGNEETYAGRVLRFEYEAHDHVLGRLGTTWVVSKVIDEQGRETTFDYEFYSDDMSSINKQANSYVGGKTRMVDALGNARAYSNGEVYKTWRLENGYYETYSASLHDGSIALESILSSHSVTYEYDLHSRITGVIDQSGMQTSYTYDEFDNLLSTTDRNGWGVTHSDESYFRALRAELGVTDSVTGLGKLVSELSEADKSLLLDAYTSRYTYDERGNMVSSSDNEGNIVEFAYTDFNKLETVTDARGGKTTYKYDNDQNLIEQIDPSGDLTRFKYDKHGNLVKEIVFLDASDLKDKALQRETVYKYDKFGNAVRVTDPEGGVTENTFDLFGNLIRSEDAEGGVSVFEYDADNRLIRAQTPTSEMFYRYDAVGNLISYQDGNAQLISYVYDQSNRLLETIDPSSDPLLTRSTRSQYDVVGNEVLRVDAEGREMVYEYDARRQLVNVISPEVVGADGSTQTRYTTTYAYDGEGNRIRINDNNGNITDVMFTADGLVREQTDAEGNVTRFDYDQNNNRIEIIAGYHLPADKRQRTLFQYDDEDQVTRITDGEGNSASYTYDAPGTVASITDANGHTTQYEYDGNNRLLKEILPGAENPQTGELAYYTIEYRYDGNGNRLAVVDQNNNETEYEYDSGNRVISVTDANDVTTLYQYDANNNVIRVEIQDELADTAQVTSFVYDAFNQLISKTDGVGHALVTSDDIVYQNQRKIMLGDAYTLVSSLSDSQKSQLLALYTERYAYDRVGNLITTIDHEGRTTNFAYDAMNRMTSQTDAKSQSQSYRYDGNGNAVLSTDERGVETERVYDKLDRVVSLDTALNKTAFEYDAFGNLIRQIVGSDQSDTTARSTRYEYDLRNLQTKQISGTVASPDQREVGYRYDAVGNRIEITDALGHKTEYQYDALNRNIKILDPKSFSTRMVYDGVGNVLKMIDARDGVTEFSFDPGNRETSVKDAEGRVTRFEYDALGNVTLRVTGSGTVGAGSRGEEVTRFEYDAQSNLVAVVAGLGAVDERTDYEYDRVYNLTSVRDARGNETQIEFDALNRQTKIIDALGQEVVYSYDAGGNMLTETRPDGRVTTYAYDDASQMIKQTDALGTETVYAYDDFGSVATITRAANRPGETQVESFEYDAFGNLKKFTDALSGTREYVYDGNNNVITEQDQRGNKTHYGYDENNRLIRIEDALGGITKYAYDANGNRSAVVDARDGVMVNHYNAANELIATRDALGFVVSYAYDVNGNLSAETRHASADVPGDALEILPTGFFDAGAFSEPAVSADDQTTSYTYDVLNRLTVETDALGEDTKYAYDANGNVLSLTDKRGNTTSYVYDVLNRLTVETDALGEDTKYTYDANGNVLSLTDKRGNTTSYVYDVLNRLTVETDALGEDTRYTYDANSNVVSVTDKRQYETTYQYDALDRMIEETDALGHSIKVEYDENGNRTAQVDKLGSRSEFTWDALNRNVEEIDALGKTVIKSYDANGNLTSLEDRRGNTTSYVYDVLNRLTVETDALGEDTRYTYDANGNVLSLTDKRGNTTSYAYDALNRLTVETDARSETTTYTYDANDNILSLTDKRGNATSYAYDVLNRLEVETDALSKNTKYSYDANGNLLTLENKRGNTTSYAYDALNRLEVETDALSQTTTYTRDANGNVLTLENKQGNTISYTYDALDRLLVETDPIGGQIAYEYDANGNQTAVEDQNNNRTESNYDALNRLKSVKNALGDTKHFSCDEEGNYTSITDESGRTTTYEFDELNRQIKETNSLDQSVITVYDAEGNIVELDERGSKVQYEYDQLNRLTGETDAIGGRTEYLLDAEGNVLQISAASGVTTFFTFDALNRKATERVGTQIDRSMTYSYDAVGNVLQMSDYRGSALYQYDEIDRNTLRTDFRGNTSETVYDAVGNSIRYTDKKGQNVYVTYDANNRAVFQLDASGRLTESVYDQVGNLVSSLEYQGHYELLNGEIPPPLIGDAVQETRTTYDALNRVLSVIAPNGLTQTFTYDLDGTVLSVAESYNPTTATSYEYENGQIVSETNAVGTVTKYIRNANDNSLIDEKIEAFGTPSERRTTYTYDDLNRLIREENSLGRVIEFTYFQSSNLITSQKTSGDDFPTVEVTKEYYADTLELKAEVNALGLRKEYSYDYTELTTTILYKDVSGQDYTTHETKDGNGNVVSTIDGDGIRNEYEYDNNNNLIRSRLAVGRDDAREVTQTWFNDKLTSITNARGHTTRFFYDADGNQTHIVTANGTVTENSYDVNGNLLESTVGKISNEITNSSTRAIFVSAGGGIKTTNTYYGDNLLKTSTVGFADGTGSQLTTTYRYDALDRLVYLTDPEGYTTSYTYDYFATESTDAAGRTQYDYDITQVITGQYLAFDDDGNVVGSDHANYDIALAARSAPQTITSTYDQAGNLLTAIDGNGNKITNTYNGLNQKTSTKTGTATGSDSQHEVVTNYQYDNAGNLVRKETSAGGVVEVTYDVMGRQTQIRTLQSGVPGVDAVWSTVNYDQYDFSGRLTVKNEVAEDGSSVRFEYTYDAHGNLKQEREAVGTAAQRTTTYQYDQMDNLISTASDGLSISYDYDSVNNRTRSIKGDSGGISTTYYDEYNRVVAVVDEANAIIDFSYDAAGNVLTTTRYATLISGAVDVSVRPSVSTTADDRTLSQEYNGNGKRISETYADGRVKTFTFDGAGQLTSMTESVISADASLLGRTTDTTDRTMSWDYDDAGRLTSFVSVDGVIETYTYDSSNNKLTTTVTNGSTLANGESDPARITTYTYDLANRLLSETVGANTQSLSYDKAGNVIRKTDALNRSYTTSYDLRGRITSIDDPLGGTLRYVLDELGNVTSITDQNNNVSQYTYDSAGRVTTLTNPNATMFVNGEVVSDASVSSKVYDLSGNLVQETDAAGNVTARWYDQRGLMLVEIDGDDVMRVYEYNAFGEVTKISTYQDRVDSRPEYSEDLPGSHPDGMTSVAEILLAYDRMGNTVSTTYPSIITTSVMISGTTVTPTDPPTQETIPIEKSFYNAWGEVVVSLDRKGSATYAEYDALGRQVKLIDPEGYLIESAFDGQGNLVKQIKYETRVSVAATNVSSDPQLSSPLPSGSGSMHAVLRFYDEQNRLIKETSAGVSLNDAIAPEGVDTLYEYDSVGNLIKRTIENDSNPFVENYYYDALDRQIAVVDARGSYVGYSYDSVGNLASMHRFFALVSGPRSSSTPPTPATTADKDQVISYEYNSLNQRVKQTQQVSSGNIETEYLYDRMGNQSRKIEVDSANGNRVSESLYDAAGRVIRTVTPNGAYSFVEYNVAGQKVLSWTGGDPDTKAPDPVHQSVSVSQGTMTDVSVDWNFAAGEDTSNISAWIAWDVASHSNLASTSSPSSGPNGTGTYKYASSAATDGRSVSFTPINEVGAGDPDPLAPGSFIYYRIVVEDALGNKSWSQEYALSAPARITELSTAKSGPSAFTFDASFEGSVSNVEILLNGSASTMNLSGGSYSVDLTGVSDPAGALVQIRWTSNGQTFTTNATTLLKADSGASVDELGWVSGNLPTDSNGVNIGDDDPAQVASQWVIVDGEKLTSTDAYRSGNFLQFDPLANSSPKSSTQFYDVFFGKQTTDKHHFELAYEDTQSRRAVALISTVEPTDEDPDGSSVWSTEWVSTDDNLINANVSMTFDTAQSDDIRLAYRAATTGADFEGTDLVMTLSDTNKYSTDITLSEQTEYDLKIYSVSSSGEETLLQWRRISTPEELLAATPGEDYTHSSLSTPTFDIPRSDSLGTSVSDTEQYGLRVLASEQNGQITGAIDNRTAITGIYTGELAVNLLSIAHTATSNGESGFQQLGALAGNQRPYYTEIQYNLLGYKIASNETNGVWSTYGVDENGKRVSTRIHGGSSPANYTPIHSSGFTEYVAYDARGFEVLKLSATGALTEKTYNYDGRLASVTTPSNTAVSGKSSAAKTYLYDGAGNLISETDAEGNETKHFYDRFGNRVRTEDAASHVEVMVYAYSGANAGLMTSRYFEGVAGTTTQSFTYDNFGRRTTLTRGTNTVTVTYDQMDNITSLRDGADNDTYYWYDTRGNQTWVKDANGNFTGKQYNAMGLVTGTYAFLGGAPANVTQAQSWVSSNDSRLVSTSTAYNVYNLKSSETNEVGEVTAYSYGDFGRLTSRGSESYSYDGYGRRTLTTDSSVGKRISYGYDADGRQISIIDSATSTNTAYTYFANGKRKSEVVTIGGSTYRNQTYSYNKNDAMTGWSDSHSDRSQSRTYTADGNLQSIGSKTYTYDAANRVTLAGSTTYTYNAMGLRASEGSTTYSYSSNGWLTGAVRSNGTDSWSYDAVGNVTQSSNGSKTETTTYDTLYRAVSSTKGEQTNTTTFDRRDRILSSSTNDDGKVYNYTYNYNSQGLQTSVTATGADDASGTSSSSYDANGKQIYVDLGTSDDDSAETKKWFLYDNEGKVVERRSDKDSTTNYLYADGQAVGEYSGSSTKLNEGIYELIPSITPGLGDEEVAVPGSTLTEHVVSAGETLKVLAARYYGSPDMWFVIAEANGLTGTETLKAGTRLAIPNSVTNSYQTADTFALYKESEILGSSLPNLTAPPPKQDECSKIVAIILVVVVAIVAIVATIVTVGAAAPAAAAALGFAAGSAAAIATTVAVGVVVGAAIAFAASAATQGILVGFGLQKEFDWKAVAADTLAGALGGAAAGLGAAVSAARTVTTTVKVVNVVGQLALETAGEAASQAIQNDGEIASPALVAIAGVAGGLGAIGDVGKRGLQTAKAGEAATEALKKGRGLNKALRNTALEVGENAAQNSGKLDTLSGLGSKSSTIQAANDAGKLSIIDDIAETSRKVAQENGKGVRWAAFKDTFRYQLGEFTGNKQYRQLTKIDMTQGERGTKFYRVLDTVGEFDNAAGGKTAVKQFINESQLIGPSAGERLATSARKVRDTAISGIRALPGRAMAGMRAVPGLAMAGASALGRGAAAVGAGASQVATAAMAGMRALPGLAMAGVRTAAKGIGILAAGSLVGGAAVMGAAAYALAKAGGAAIAGIRALPGLARAGAGALVRGAEVARTAVGAGASRVATAAMAGMRAVPGLAMAGASALGRGATAVGAGASRVATAAMAGMRAVPGLAMAGGRALGRAADAALTAMGKAKDSVIASWNSFKYDRDIGLRLFYQSGDSRSMKAAKTLGVVTFSPFVGFWYASQKFAGVIDSRMARLAKEVDGELVPTAFYKSAKNADSAGDALSAAAIVIDVFNPGDIWIRKDANGEEMSTDGSLYSTTAVARKGFNVNYTLVNKVASFGRPIFKAAIPALADTWGGYALDEKDGVLDGDEIADWFEVGGDQETERYDRIRSLRSGLGLPRYDSDVFARRSFQGQRNGVVTYFAPDWTTIAASATTQFYSPFSIDHGSKWSGYMKSNRLHAGEVHRFSKQEILQHAQTIYGGIGGDASKAPLQFS